MAKAASPALGRTLCHYDLALSLSPAPPDTNGGYADISFFYQARLDCADCPHPSRPLHSPSSPSISQLQPALEAELRRRLAAEPHLTLWQGWRVTAVAEEEGGGSGGGGGIVRLDCQRVGGGGSEEPPRRPSARFCIGADGGSSGVRKGLGLAFAGSSLADEPWLCVDVETDDPGLCARWQASRG